MTEEEALARSRRKKKAKEEIIRGIQNKDLERIARSVAIVTFDMRKFVELYQGEGLDSIEYMDKIQQWTTALENISVNKFFKGEITDATQRPEFLQIGDKDSKTEQEAPKKIESETVTEREVER